MDHEIWCFHVKKSELSYCSKKTYVLITAEALTPGIPKIPDGQGFRKLFRVSYSLALLRPKTLPKGYPALPEDLGEHIRKRRLDLGLLQIETAKIIGVTESTVWNWEHGTEPELIHMPKIIDFLGYIPFECPEDPLGKLRYFKKVRGLSYERLGAVMGRNSEQLEDWLSGRIQPCRKNVERIAGFLAQEPFRWSQTFSTANRKASSFSAFLK